MDACLRGPREPPAKRWPAQTGTSVRIAPHPPLIYLVSSADKSIGLRNRGSHVRIVHEVPPNQPCSIPVRVRMQSDGTRGCSSTGKASVSKTEGSRFDPVHPRHPCLSRRRSQAVEGDGLQNRRRQPTSVRIRPSPPARPALVCRWSIPFITPVAQPVERLAVNQERGGSIPSRGAISTTRSWLHSSAGRASS